MGSGYLAWRYIVRHRRKVGVLVAAITLVLWLPLAIQIMVDRTAEQLRDRAQQTPLVIGAPGSALELALSSLYFRGQTPPTMGYDALERTQATGLSDAIPLYVRFNVRGFPVVGTSPGYFDFRRLRLAQGRRMALLGEAVLGAEAARQLGVGVGGAVITAPESLFDIAGIYPLKMSVVGILAPTLGPDDDAVFVDIKTSWIIQGLGHGHQDLNQPLTRSETARQILKTEDGNRVANASVKQFNEITDANIDSFHFHGDNRGYPISAILPVTDRHKDQAMLLGIYGEERDDAQILRAPRVIDGLMETLFQVRSYVIGGISLIAIATGLVAILVFNLSLQLRQGERQTLAKIGASRWQIGTLMAAELLVVLVASLLLAGLLILLTREYGMLLLQHLLLE
jgi:putative ABC transport system permease protein